MPPRPTLELNVNGASRAFSLAQRDGGHELRFVLSDDTATEYYDIALRTLWPVVETADLKDSRNLGIAVSSIAFAPDNRLPQPSQPAV